jgi:hypothetical protein
MSHRLTITRALKLNRSIMGVQKRIVSLTCYQVVLFVNRTAGLHSFPDVVLMPHI